MNHYSDRIPELQDEVKHKRNDTVGVVIAKLSNPITGQVYLDVRVDDHIKYATPIENWDVVRIEEDLL